MNIPGETNAVLTINNVAPEDGADYSVIVSNSAGNATSNVATLTVIENTIPIAEILNPGSGTTYAAGTSIEFSGAGSDNEDGVLPATASDGKLIFIMMRINTMNHPLKVLRTALF